MEELRIWGRPRILLKGDNFMDNSRISVPEAISIVLIVLVAHTLVSLPKSLLNVTGSATIINLLYVGIILFFIVFFIVKLYRYFAGQDIIDISNFLGGPVFQKIVGIIFILYFVFSSSILLRNFCECLKIVERFLPLYLHLRL